MDIAGASEDSGRRIPPQEGAGYEDFLLVDWGLAHHRDRRVRWMLGVLASAVESWRKTKCCCVATMGRATRAGRASPRDVAPDRHGLGDDNVISVDDAGCGPHQGATSKVHGRLSARCVTRSSSSRRAPESRAFRGLLLSARLDVSRAKIANALTKDDDWLARRDSRKKNLFLSRTAGRECGATCARKHPIPRANAPSRFDGDSRRRCGSQTLASSLGIPTGAWPHGIQHGRLSRTRPSMHAKSAGLALDEKTPIARYRCSHHPFGGAVRASVAIRLARVTTGAYKDSQYRTGLIFRIRGRKGSQ